MRSNIVLSCACAALLGAAAAAQGNVLIIIADDFGVDNLASYGVGHDLPSTPVLDSLAATGVVFTNAWGHPLCTPSRAAIQTGLHPFRTGLGGNTQSGGPALSPDHVIIPEALDQLELGYTHAYFGKWHLSNSSVGGALGPNIAGYSHFAGVMANLGIQPSAYFTWQKVVDGATSTKQGYITSDTVDDALDWIGAQASPWLAFVAFSAPHSPFHAPPEHLHTVDLSSAGPPNLDKRPYFRAMVQAMDTEIGRLLSGIGSDLAQTTVLFLGDNGTADDVIAPPLNPAHCKGTAYEGGVRIPFIASGPRVVQPGRTCSALVSVQDVFATVMGLAKLPPPLRGGSPRKPAPAEMGTPKSLPLALHGVPTAFDSVSFLPYLLDPSAPSARKYIWTEVFFPNGFGNSISSRRSIRGERYKLMHNLGQLDPPLPGGIYFFDLLQDPFEKVNLWSIGLTPAQKEEFLELRNEALAILDS